MRALDCLARVHTPPEAIEGHTTMARDLLADMRAALADGVELTEKQLQILVRVDPFAEKLYALGYAAGQRAGLKKSLEETMDEYDKSVHWKKVDRPPTA